MEKNAEKTRKKADFRKIIATHPQLATLMLFVLVVVIFTIFSPVGKSGIPTFVTPKNIDSILQQTAIISVTAFGMTLVLLINGIDLSVGAVMALVGVVASNLLEYQGWGTLPVIFISLLIGAVIGYLNGALIVYGRVVAFLITLGMMNIARGLGYVISQGQSVYVNDQLIRQIFVRFQIFGVSVLIWWTLAFLILMYVIVSKTKFGRRAQAIGGNEEAAINSGVRVNRVKIMVYTLNGLIAAFAGLIMIARLGNGSANVGEGAEMNAIAAAVLGGTFAGDGGNMLGTLLGSLVIGTIVNGLTIMGVNSYVQTVVKGVIIIATVVGSMALSRKK